MEYYSLNQYLRDRFGEKVYKIALDGGFTCPNRDGTIDTRGCIFCSGMGSGDFAEDRCNSITEQIEKGKQRLSDKITNGKYIAYFQAFTNTYAPVEELRRKYMEAVHHPDIVAVSIATRPDCLSDEVLGLLDELNHIKPIWVELGLQTIHERTAKYIRRGYSLQIYDDAVAKLKAMDVNIIVHVILGLPGESRKEMLETVHYVGNSHVNGIKLQLLHVIKGTDLEKEYQKGTFHVMEMEEYTDLVADCIALLPEDMVIHRMTGDGDKKTLVAPLWSGDKKKVLNLLNKKIAAKSRQYDVVALGELLIDFTENGVSAQGYPMMEVNPGGAPCNVLAMVQQLGHKTSFIGKVGKDMFGYRLKNTLIDVGIGIEGLVMDEEVSTTLAFVHTLPDGDREFSFYRNPGADMMLTEEEVKETLIAETRVFHFGTLSMTHEGCRLATKKALDIAKDHHCIISFDPNLREPLWDSMDLAREQVMYGLGYCDILKISDNEIQWLTGEQDYAQGITWIRERFDIPLILVSLGREGSMAYSKSGYAKVPAFIRENTIETTGAGDTFCGCVLHYVLEHGMKDYSSEELKAMLTFANAAASIITTRKGALRVMPKKEEIENDLSGY